MSVPDLMLEQYRLGELPRGEAERIERLLGEDDVLRRRLDALDASDREIALRYPAQWLAARVQDRAGRSPVRTRPAQAPSRRWAIAAALGAAAFLIVFAVPGALNGPEPAEDRLKGLSPTLAVYRRTPHGSETLADGAAARAGDLLRLGYVSAGRGYGVILSIDGRGVVTLHLPPEGGRAAALRAGATILLEQAYELDDAPAWERFYFITSDTPFDVAPVMDAARRAAARSGRTPPPSLPIPRELGQSTFSIQKEVRP